MGKVGGWGKPTGFGARLRALRLASGMTVQDLAEKAVCGFSTVEKLELGLQEPAWPLVLRLAGALAVTPDAFMAVEGAAPPAKRPRGRPRKT